MLLSHRQIGIYCKIHYSMDKTSDSLCLYENFSVTSFMKNIRK